MPNSVDSRFNRDVTRTKATEKAYECRVQQLRKRVGKETRASSVGLLDCVDWFSEQHGRFAKATIRQYTSALKWALGVALAAGELSRNSYTPACDTLRMPPNPRNDSKRQTSARKRKTLAIEEFHKIINHVLNSPSSKDDRLLAQYMIFGRLYFLRPCEWLNAKIAGDWLVVTNAKATNGRSHGEDRRLSIKEIGVDGCRTLAEFLVNFKKAASLAESPQHLMNRLASRLARVCKALGLRRISLYTIRHVGIATAKTYLQPAEIAALAGHSNDRTAFSHYARRTAGHRSIRYRTTAAPADVARVRVTGRTRFRPAANAILSAIRPATCNDSLAFRSSASERHEPTEFIEFSPLQKIF